MTPSRLCQCQAHVDHPFLYSVLRSSFMNTSMFLFSYSLLAVKGILGCMVMTATVLSRFSVATRNIGGYVDLRSVLSMEYASRLDGAHVDQNLGNGAFMIYTNKTEENMV